MFNRLKFKSNRNQAIRSTVSGVIPSSGVSTLYYYCASHPGMGGKIIIKDQVASGGGGLGNGGGGSGGGGGIGY